MDAHFVKVIFLGLSVYVQDAYFSQIPIHTEGAVHFIPCLNWSRFAMLDTRHGQEIVPV
jgi:hypothetical protein